MRRLGAALVLGLAAAMAAAAQEPAKTLAGHERSPLGLAFSPDGARLASVADDETLRIWDVASGKPLVTAKGTSPNANAVVWTPDGTGVLCLADRGVRRFDAATGKTVRDFPLEVPGGPAAFSLSGDGKTLAVVGRAAIAFFAAETGDSKGQFEVHPGYGVSGVALSPDATRAATASSDHTVAIVEVASGKVLSSFDLKTHVTRVAWSPDGKRLFVAKEMSCNTFVSLDPSGGAEQVLDDEGLPKLDFHPSADGRWVVVAGNAHQPRVWDVAANAWKPKALKEHMAQVRAVAISPDGKWIASGDQQGEIRLYETATVTGK